MQWEYLRNILYEFTDIQYGYTVLSRQGGRGQFVAAPTLPLYQYAQEANMEWFLKCVKEHYFDFNGRARRKEY